MGAVVESRLWERTVAPWRSFSDDGLAMPQDAARFSTFAATAIADSATAARPAVNGLAAVNCAKPIDATSRVRWENSTTVPISATIVCAIPKKA